MGAAAIPIIFGVASAASGVYSTIEQKNAVDDANKANADQASRTIASNQAVADQQERDLQSRLARQYNALSGRARAAGASRGVVGSASQSAIERNLAVGAFRESANAKINLELQKNAIAVNNTAQYIPEKSIAGGLLSSLLSGASSGLGIVGSLQGLDQANSMAKISDAASQSQTSFVNSFMGFKLPDPSQTTY